MGNTPWKPSGKNCSSVFRASFPRCRKPSNEPGILLKNMEVRKANDTMSLEAGMSDSESRPVIKGPDVLLQDLDGEAVLLNLRNGQYYGLDENSYHMYQTLTSSP